MRAQDRRAYLTFAQTKAYARRVDVARRLLTEASQRGPIVICTSWGKDSIALCHLALETLGRVPLFHMATAYRLPGDDEVVEYFQARTDVHVLESRLTLDEYINFAKTVGLPHERTGGNAGAKRSKAKRAGEWAEEHGFTVQALGLRIAEKGPRAALLRTKGPLYQLVDGTSRVHPLAYFTHTDVWATIVAHDLPYNRRIYDSETHGLTRETIRNTGWLSTDGAHHGRIGWLKEHFPEHYAQLAAHFPRIRHFL